MTGVWNILGLALVELAVVGMVWFGAWLFKPEFASNTVTFLAFVAGTIVVFLK